MYFDQEAEDYFRKLRLVKALDPGGYLGWAHCTFLGCRCFAIRAVSVRRDVLGGGKVPGTFALACSRESTESETRFAERRRTPQTQAKSLHRFSDTRIDWYAPQDSHDPEDSGRFPDSAHPKNGESAWLPMAAFLFRIPFSG